jgi:integrase/recombinase XerC
MIDAADAPDDAVETPHEEPTTLAIVVTEPSEAPREALTVLPAPPPRNQARELVEAFLRGRKKSTLDAYKKDLEYFAAFLEVPTAEEAARMLLTSNAGDANALALRYRDTLVDLGSAPATIDRRLSSLKALVQLARMLGMVTWAIEVRGVGAEAYKDTRGPGDEAIAAMLERAASRGDAKGLRDVAIVRLLRDVALRRGEVVSLDVEHFDPERGLSILGKGRRQREWVSLPTATTKAVAAWLKARGGIDGAGPLFIALDKLNHGHRLTGSSVYDIIKRLGVAVGVQTRPHGLRHTAITKALDTMHGDLRKVQKFSRHRNPQTLMIYDDARTDMAGEVASLGAMPDAAEPVDEDVNTTSLHEAFVGCARGHVYDARFVGKYCVQGECEHGVRQDPARRIEERKT